MKVNSDIINNTVSAQNQILKKIKIHDREDADLRVIFLGNSITLHGVAPSIGWLGEWGMAASEPEKDYVHLVVSALEKKYKVGYCVCNVAEWERAYYDEEILKYYETARNFNADIVIVRLGENVYRQDLDKYDFADALKKFVNYFKTETNKVLITDTFWEYEPICKAEKKVAEEMKTEFLVISDLGYKDKNKAIGKFEHSGVASHPGDLGMQRIAERIFNRLTLML